MCITPANIRPRLLFVVATLSLSGAGCVHLGTPAERDASFSLYKDAKVGEESLQGYLIDRSGFVLGAKSFDTTSTGEYSVRFTSKPPLNLGTAAAIDKRGYFLTAAHCVERGQFRLGFLRNDRLHVVHPRIVWRGDVKKGEPDLAILCVSHPISHTFQWAAEFTKGSPVVNAGLSMNADSRRFQPQCMAGRILKVSESGDFLDYTIVSHSSPLRPGDSGGPLVLSDGRLLGINVMVKPDFPDVEWGHFSFGQHSEAHRPDLVWLRKAIDADAAFQARRSERQPLTGAMKLFPRETMRQQNARCASPSMGMLQLAGITGSFFHSALRVRNHSGPLAEF